MRVCVCGRALNEPKNCAYNDSTTSHQFIENKVFTMICEATFVFCKEMLVVELHQTPLLPDSLFWIWSVHVNDTIDPIDVVVDSRIDTGKSALSTAV